MENTPKISKVPENFKKRKMRYKSDEIICFVQFMQMSWMDLMTSRKIKIYVQLSASIYFYTDFLATISTENEKNPK